MSDRIDNLDNLSPEAKRTLLAKMLAAKKQDGPPAPFPLSFAQERLWFLEQYEPGKPVFNMPLAYELTGQLNVPILHQSINEIVARHQSLRTIFKDNNGRPIQIVQANLDIPLPVIDLSALESAEQETRITAERQQLFEKPFNLEAGPLLRGVLLRLTPEKHLLYMTMHHIISDGWSLGVFFQELVDLYGAYTAGRPSPLTPLPIQYERHVHRQRDYLTGAIFSEQLAYWQRALAGAPLALSLPTDRPRPAMQSHAGKRLTFSLGKGLTTAVKTLSQAERVTPFMLLLAAFNLLLARYTGQPDLLVGTPIAGRTDDEIEQLIGLFLNVLILRTKTHEADTFQELLEQVRQTALSAYEHQDFPVEKLIDELNPARDLSYNPLYQVWFAMQNQPWQGFDLPGLTIRQLESFTRTSKVDLSFYMTEGTAGFEGICEYNSDLFDETTITRFIGNYKVLLEAAVAQPTTPLAHLPLLTTAEIEQRQKWNQTQQPLPAEQSMHHWFENQVERTPDAKALTFQGQTLTYRELNQLANQLAHYLQSLGLGPDIRVGLHLERSLEMEIAVLATFKASGAYVPLDPSLPAERLAYMTTDSGAAVLLTQRNNEQIPLADGVRRIYIDDIESDLAAYSPDNLPWQAMSDNLAYIMYTSGSTGRPKGVRIPMKGVVHILSAMRRVPGLTEKDTLLAVITLSFDMSVFELMLPLVTGAHLVIASKEETADGWLLQEALTTSQATIMQATPATWQLLVDSGWQGNGKLRACTGGEALSPELAEALLDRCALLWNLYGPTEVTIYGAGYLVPRGIKGNMPIGRPVDNKQLHILDANFQPVPVGVPGELYIGGGGLAQGYHKRPSLSATKFVPNPFSQQPGDRLYSTGDVVRFGPDGIIEYMGRQDHQVKIRGFRIELGEIESTLRSQTAVSDAVVTAHEDQATGKRLVAYIVPEDDKTPPQKQSLRDGIAAVLPDYMLPSNFIFLDAFPRNPNGKIDRKALPQPERDHESPTQSYQPPQTQLQSLLAAIWGDVLGQYKVGLDDNFFELGGHSLLATQVISRLREALDQQIPLQHLFEFPTIRRFSQAVQAAQGDNSTMPPIQPQPTTEHLPLSFAQLRLWVLDQFEEGDSIAFNLATALELKGQLNVAALERSLAEIVTRHTSLRTNFVLVDNEPRQSIQSVPEAFPLPITPLHPDAVQEQLRLAVKEPFNLETGPLIRGRLFKVSDDEHVLLIMMHHIVSDGWSLDIFFRELTILYRAFSTDEPSPLTPLTLQYSDFAHWQRTYQEAAVFEQQLTYWQKTLAGASMVLELPTDRPRPTIQTNNGRHFTFQLPPELTAALKKVSAQEQATLFMLLLSAFQMLLARYSGQKDFLVGTPIAGRNQKDIENIIGFFLNTLVLRADLSGNPTFRSLLGRVRKTALDAYAHQDIPVERLIDDLNPVRDMSRSPLFQTLFALQNMPWSGFDLPGLSVRPLSGYTETAKLDLSVYMVELPEGLQGIVEYNSDLFDEATMLRLAGHYEQLLRGIVANPERPIDSYSILPTAERRQLLSDWNQTARPYPAHETLQTLFAAQTAKTPQATAFIEGQQRISYETLHRRSNQIAHLLQNKQIGPGSVVGISLSRSIDMVVALLGILKTGAAYLPLDPSYPAERLSFMATDADMAILLTESGNADILSAFNKPTIYLDANLDPTKELPESDLAVSAVSPEAVAYLIYTSGSTGQPKGVAAPHKQIINRLNWMWREYPFQPGEVGSQRTALNFVDSIWEIFGPLLQGIPTVIIPDETVQDPAEFVAALGTHEVSRLWLVPSLLRVMLDTMPDLAQRLPKLKFWVTSGETIPMELFHRFQQQMPNATIYNLYGTSEVWDITWYPPEESHANLTRVPIGKPLDNMSCYILDKDMRLVPIGVPGDLYVAGEGLAQGYLKRPSRTATTFVPHPYSQKPGARLNRTGDMARYLSDGHIEFLGRRDFQVKVRGFRVELGEVESVLLQHSAVQSAVVIAREIQPGQQRLIAYVVPQSESNPAVTDLRDFLSQSLPEPMIPSSFVFLAALPLTPNGKVDRKGLPEPDSSRPELSEQYVAPRSTAETVVADIWMEVLDLSKVGAFDNFFELGGHSLLATQVTFKLQETFQVNFPLHEVFNKPTVAGMVENLIQFWGDQEIVEEIANTWQEISQMSADEAADLLAETQSSD